MTTRTDGRAHGEHASHRADLERGTRRRDGFVRLSEDTGEDAPERERACTALAADMPPFEVCHFIESRRLHDGCAFILAITNLAFTVSSWMAGDDWNWYLLEFLSGVSHASYLDSRPTADCRRCRPDG